MMTAPGYLQAVGSEAPSSAVARPQSSGATAPAVSPQRALLNQYRIACHNQRTRTAGLALDTLDVSRVKEQPHTAALLRRLMQASGLSIEGHRVDASVCHDCLQTRRDQAQAVVERDRRMEAEFAGARN
jgi:hypothetical protein